MSTHNHLNSSSRGSNALFQPPWTPIHTEHSRHTHMHIKYIFKRAIGMGGIVRWDLLNKYFPIKWQGRAKHETPVKGGHFPSVKAGAESSSSWGLAPDSRPDKKVNGFGVRMKACIKTNIYHELHSSFTASIARQPQKHYLEFLRLLIHIENKTRPSVCLSGMGLERWCSG